MKKAKFDEKCAYLRAFEEETLNSAKQYFDKYIALLQAKDLALDIDLTWAKFNAYDASYERMPFQYGYTCSIGLQIRKKEDNGRDMDLIAVTSVLLITVICKNFFGFFKFTTCPLNIVQESFIDFEKTINDVLNRGYDSVLNELVKVDKKSH